MAVVGWAALVVILAGATLVAALGMINNLGQYNIGGVPNTLLKKVLTVLAAVVLAAAWWWLLTDGAPFRLYLKTEG